MTTLADTTALDQASAALGEPALRILALDLSLTATGVALPDGTTATIATKTKDGDRRLLHIAHAIANAVAAGIDLAVIEDLPTHAHGAGITGMVHGAARAVLLEAGVPYVVVTPATLKKYATGKGNADKTAMAIAALKRAGREFANDNEVDAAWLRWAALHHYGQPPFPLPAVQVEALAKVAWPDLPAVVAR